MINVLVLWERKLDLLVECMKRMLIILELLGGRYNVKGKFYCGL